MAKKKNQHEAQVLAYLRGGNMVGAAPLEALIKAAADAIDPAVKTGPKGIGITMSCLRSAATLLSDATSESGLALAEHRERLTRTSRGGR